MNYDELLQQVTPELYGTFKRSLELGRWPDGREMTAEQREHCLRAVIAYDDLHKPETERVGWLPKRQPGGAAPSADELKWVAGGSVDKEEGQ